MISDKDLRQLLLSVPESPWTVMNTNQGFCVQGWTKRGHRYIAQLITDENTARLMAMAKVLAQEVLELRMTLKQYQNKEVK